MRTPIALLIAALSALPLAAQPLPLPGLSAADYDTFGYQLSEASWGRSFVLRAPVRALLASAEARVLVNVQDERNYYAVSLTPTGTRLLRVEDGVEVPIGHRSDVGLGVQASADVFVRRQADRLEVFVNGTRAAFGADGWLSGGVCGWGARDGSAVFGEVVEQPDAPIYFDDEFMRAEEDDSDWEVISGAWRLQAVENALRSSNGFNYQYDPADGPGLSAVGHWFWDNYRLDASCQPHGPGRIGLLAHYADKDNYYRVTWSDSELTLERVRRGRSQPLASVAGGYIPGQWYRLGLSVDHGRIRAFVDGAQVLEAWDGSLFGGRAGLYAAGDSAVTFDDVQVRESPVSPLWLSDLSDWIAIGGKWQGQVLEQGGPMGRCRARADAAAKLLMRSAPPRNAALRAEVRVRAEEAGLCAGYEDEGNYYALVYSPGRRAARIVRVRDGAATDLASAEVGAADPIVLELRMNGGQVTGLAGDVRLDAWDGDLPRGAAGLFLANGQADFTEVSCEQMAPLPSIATYHETFSHERSMESWAEATSDWSVTTAPEGAAAHEVLHWHRASVPGDSVVTANIVAAPTGPVTVVTGAEEPGVGAGYALAVTPGTPGRAVLTRDGVEVANTEIAALAPESLESVSIRRQGGVVSGSVNGEAKVAFADPEPLTGTRVAWAAPEGVVDGGAVEVAAATVLSDSFRAAPASWWTATGSWEVTNRWDCDPRWSFFSGASEGGLASLWHKDEFGEDIAVEFCGATQFDGARGTYNYVWARDINCTIAADGEDLTSGYSFIFGGWDDQYTRLMRGTEVVAETTEHLIPRSSSAHRQWFYLQIEKRGARIRCWLDGALLFDYTDPEPLTGKRMALWTYDNGIAVARVRVSSNERHPSPFPSTAPSAPRCHYDPEPGDDLPSD